MNVQISIRHMKASQVNKRMVHELCEEVKNKYEGIQYIDVKIEDINGPHKSGIDKRCHLKVRGRDHLAIDINDTNEDITCAIDNAFHHLKQVLQRCHPYQVYRRVSSFGSNNCYSIEA